MPVNQLRDPAIYEERKAQSQGSEHAAYFRSFEIWDQDSGQWSKLEAIRDEVESEPCTVIQFMTGDLVTVIPETPIEAVVRDMVDAHVHRVLVLDGQEKLLGIITTTDVLAALLDSSRRMSQ